MVVMTIKKNPLTLTWRRLATEEGGRIVLERRVSFLCYEKLRDHFFYEVSRCWAVEVDILCILFTVAEFVSRTILYHFKKINWIGTHWRGTRRRSPVEGVNSVIKFCFCVFVLGICLPVLFFIPVLSI